MDEILKYFTHLTAQQIRQYTQLSELYKDWNAKINVISRKDIENIYTHHVLHSLAIAKDIAFKDGSNILDFGTGGGFPGIPLAIMFPQCKFKLIDGTAKKLLVTSEVSQAIGLKNVTIEHLRGEEERGKYDFIVSRAVMPINDLMRIISHNVSKTQRNARPNGLICLKGGDVNDEISAYKHIAEVTPIESIFTEEWFKEKKIVYIPI